MAMWEHGVKTRIPKPKSLTHQQMHDFAATSEKGLPKRVGVAKIAGKMRKKKGPP